MKSYDEEIMYYQIIEDEMNFFHRRFRNFDLVKEYIKEHKYIRIEKISNLIIIGDEQN